MSVKCYYSDRLKDEEKKWCRSGNLHSCQTEQDTQSSQDPKQQLRDEGRGVFTVTLTALQKADGGWFWCMAGGIQSPIHLTITAAPTLQNHTDFPEWTSSSQHSSTTAIPTPTYSTLTQPNSTHSTHTPPNSTHLTHTPPNSTYKPAGSSPVTAQLPNKTQPTSTPTALSKHPSTSPTATDGSVMCAASRPFVWPLAAVGIILTAVVVTTLIWRRQKHQQVSHMMLEGAEPIEFSVKDDVDLLDYEWTDRTVLKLEEEPNTAARL